MRLSITSIALLAATILSVVSAQNYTGRHGICTCFEPKYDGSCCMLVKGSMQKDGNVCDTPDIDESVAKFRSCCDHIGGRSKCKYGYHDPNNWPPKDQFNC
ncbi:hypothetical protein FBU30_000808 [Linnemannia zychae]|nr:hypothetical protein FBU30_000808 [Linnemannia zychae]